MKIIDLTNQSSDQANRAYTDYTLEKAKELADNWAKEIENQVKEASSHPAIVFNRNTDLAIVGVIDIYTIAAQFLMNKSISFYEKLGLNAPLFLNKL